MSSIQLVKIRQSFGGDSIPDVERTTRNRLAAVPLHFTEGAPIAIAVGSRGIANLAQIVKTTADYVRKRGGQPFIVPAMGSHGGATAEGQSQVLESFGITEDRMG